MKSNKIESKPAAVLKAPVNIATLAAEMENQSIDMQSIWVVNRDQTNVFIFYFVLTVQ